MLFSGALVTFHFKDNWIRYSGAINRFETELNNFNLETGVYRQREKAVDIFLRRIQEITAEETEEWRKMMTQVIKDVTENVQQSGGA